MLKSILNVALLGMALAAATSASATPLTLYTRGQVATEDWVAPENKNTDLAPPRSASSHTYVHGVAEWAPEKTALVIVNMWDRLKAPLVWKRMDELAPAIDQLAAAARARGVLVVHAPTGTMEFYKDAPQRGAAREATPETLVELPDASSLPPHPLQTPDNGWEGPVRAGTPQSRQHPGITIAEGDVIGEAPEIYGLLEARGIRHVLVAGVHANFDLLTGPLSLRQMAAQGVDALLVRDLTDSRYNPQSEPRVSHVRGTELAVDYLERIGARTVESTDLTGLPAFRFKEDTRPHVAFIVSDDHYHADKTIPEFARGLREGGYHVSVLHGAGGHHIPGTENLANADLAGVYVRRLALPADQLRRLREFIAAGKPLVGLRTASHAFKLKRGPEGSYPLPEGTAEWGSFDAEILGGNYTGHEANEPGSDIQNVAGGHPILAGVEPAAWHSKGSLYNAAPIAGDALLLQEGRLGDVVEPVTWIREAANGRGRVFYTSLGHPADFDEPAFRRLLENGIAWALGKTAD